jgi:hypothetical protein
MWAIGYFYHKKWYNKTYGLGVFKEGAVLNDDLHGKRCSILFSCNIWFKVVKIKTKQGLL